MTTTNTGYAFPHNDRTQIECLQLFLDPITWAELGRLDVGPGMRCWDLGAGGGSVAAMLANLVGPTGVVAVTDTDISQLTHLLERRNVHVYRHDARDLTVPPPGQFDRFTERLALLHIPQRRQILAAAVQALAPGGRVLLGEFDCTRPLRVVTSPSLTASRLFTRVTLGIIEVLTSRGADMAWAQQAHAELVGLGLTDVVTKIHEQSWIGGSHGCLLHEINSLQLQPHLLELGDITEQDLTDFRSLMHNPRFVAMSYTFVSTQGRKAAGAVL